MYCRFRDASGFTGADTALALFLAMVCVAVSGSAGLAALSAAESVRRSREAVAVLQNELALARAGLAGRTGVWEQVASGVSVMRSVFYLSGGESGLAVTVRVTASGGRVIFERTGWELVR